jgi:membrane dipeptidase
VVPVAAMEACGCASLAGRRAFLASLLAVISAACAGPGVVAQNRRQRDLVAQGAAAVTGAPVIDLHAHPGAFTRAVTGELPQAAMDDMRAGGVDVAFFAAVADGLVIRREPGRIRQWREPGPGELYRNTQGQLTRVLARTRAGDLDLVLSPRDLASATSGGRRGALLAIEGGDALEGDAGRVREFHAMGVRSIQLVHYRINELGDIQTEPARHGGLTPAGREVIAEMNRLGMIVDAAHASPATLRDILSTSRRPVIVSHTGPAALRDVPRPHGDAHLRRVAGRASGPWLPGPPASASGSTISTTCGASPASIPWASGRTWRGSRPSRCCRPTAAFRSCRPPSWPGAMRQPTSGRSWAGT